MKKVALENLREQIALAVATTKAYEVPSVCVRLGLQERVGEADKQEAFSSKRVYTKSRLATKTEPELLAIAELVLREFEYEPLAEIISEMTRHAEHRVSKLVRLDLLKSLNVLENLFGELPVLDSLAEVFGDSSINDDLSGMSKIHSTQGQINQHYLRNDDWSHQELLTFCGALTCSQTRFFKLLEKLLHPIVRRDAEQAKLAAIFDGYLKRDGFAVRPVESESGYAIYGVVRAATGVSGSMKNLIFASIGEKPELIIRDAVNNDVEIVKHADKVLVFDRALPSSGLLLWKDLAQWWADAHALPSAADAKLPLYRRLKQSVRSANSPGELAVFHTYYERYGAQLADRLPALIPQVYLHYDPYTQRQRGDEAFLVRQRMDFLLMLENGARVVIEIDGRQHYGDQDTTDRSVYVANAKRYAEMVGEDRRLRTAGYEVYRFGGYEFRNVDPATGKVDAESQKTVADFFDRLLKKHGVL